MTASGRAPGGPAVRRIPTKTQRPVNTSDEGRQPKPPPESTDGSGASALGPRLRERREAMGVSLRQFARDLNVSASFISQLETGKTQPSVATLYAICTALNMTIDDVFDATPSSEREASIEIASDSSSKRPEQADAQTRSDGQARIVRASGRSMRSPIVSPSERRRITLDSGVTWERLSSSTNANFDFVFVRYDVGGSSNTDGRLIRHVGTECGYVLRGTLEVTLGFETFVMGPGDAISYDSSTPHRLANVGDVPVEAIWFDEGGHNRQS
jgi:transcriptional regulator with XRE-family HTH domain